MSAAAHTGGARGRHSAAALARFAPPPPPCQLPPLRADVRSMPPTPTPAILRPTVALVAPPAVAAARFRRARVSPAPARAPRRASAFISAPRPGMPPPRSAAAAAPVSSAGSDSDATDDAAHVAAETALFESFSAVPSCAGASLVRDPRDPTAAPTLHVATSQRDLAANRSRRSVAVLPLPSRAPTHGDHLNHPAFGVEERGALLTSVSPSGARRLVVRSGKDAGGDRDGVSLEIWEGGALVSEVLVPAKTHGTLCGDGTFGGVDWSANEGRIVYVAEAPRDGPTPEWGMGVTVAAAAPAAGEGEGKESGEDAAKASSSSKKSWKGQGEWREEWGEQLVGRVAPSAFVLDVATGTVTRLAGLPADAVAASGPVWAPPTRPGEESDSVVCPAWLGDIDNFKSTSRRLGLVFCFNRPSALFLARAPTDPAEPAPPATRITPNSRSAMWPRFTPDGQTLVFVSHERAVESGAHFATASLRAVSWSADGVAGEERVVVPVVDVPERRGAFPGLYVMSPPPAEPWLVSEDGSEVEMVLQTTWGAGEAIATVNLSTGATTRITPPAAAGEGAWIGEGNPDAENDADVESGGGGSWTLCDVRDGIVAAVRSSPGSVPEARVAWFRKSGDEDPFRGWTRVKSAYAGAAAKPAMDAIASLEYDVVTVSRECVAGDGGDANPDAPATVQSIVVRRRADEDADVDAGPRPTIILPHGGPHASCAAGYVATVAYLASLGYAVAYCNYRGSTGYGEKALQTLVGGAAGVADVADCVAVARRAVDDGAADPDRVCVVGGSHGGFLGAHLIGQHPEMFKCAVLRNPVTDVASMVNLTDIPDWCYVETVGKDAYADLPSVETLAAMRAASPVAHIDAVRAPVLMLLGAVDLRVPPTNGLRYAAALRERGGDCRVRVFPEDAHGLVNPRTEFESFVTVAAFLREHMGAPR